MDRDPASNGRPDAMAVHNGLAERVDGMLPLPQGHGTLGDRDMAKKRKTAHEDPRSAAFYENRRGDISPWSAEPVPARVASSGSVVVSIRLAIGELEAVRRAAAHYGMTLSDLVRTAILRTIYAPPAMAVGSGEFTRSGITTVHGLAGGAYCMSAPTRGAAYSLGA